MYSFPNSHSHLNALSRWGDINHFAPGASFLRRIESLTMLQRHRHFRSEIFEVVTLGGSTHENRERAFALFSDALLENLNCHRTKNAQTHFFILQLFY